MTMHAAQFCPAARCLASGPSSDTSTPATWTNEPSKGGGGRCPQILIDMFAARVRQWTGVRGGDREVRDDEDHFAKARTGTRPRRECRQVVEI